MNRLLFAITVFLMLLPMTAWGLASNWEFEEGFQANGVANDWTQYGGAVNSSSNTIFHVNPDSPEKIWSQKVDASASEGGVQQEIAYKPGRLHSIKVWAKCEAGATARISPDGGATWVSSTSTSWSELVTTHQATGSKTLILKAVGGVVYFDDALVGDANPTIVTNPGFELGFGPDGLGIGWALHGNSVNSGSNTVVYGGLWSQKCDATGGLGGVEQLVNYELGKQYILEAWVKCEPGASARISPDGAIFSGSTLSTNWDWLSVTLPVAPASATMVLEAEGGVVYFDDVKISVVDPTVGLPDPDGVPIKKLWEENVNPGGIGGNPFFCGGVFDGNVIFGQVDSCVRMYGDTQVNGTALLHNTPRHENNPVPDNPEHTSKCATIINGYIWSITGLGDFQVSKDWGELGPMINFNNNPQPRWKQNNDGAGMATDGTHLYAYETYGPSNNAITKIYKWAVSVTMVGDVPHGTITPVAPFPKTINGYSRIAGIGYWGGKIYAAEAFNGGQILEIDCDTGAVSPLLAAPNLVPNVVGNWGQVARYGDKIFYATHNGFLITWKKIGSTWTIVSADNAGLWTTGNAYGIAVKGDGVNATNCWINTGGLTIYYDLREPINLAEVNFGAGDSVWVGKAVVTARNPGVGFWIENEQRTAAAWVPSEENPPAGNYVSVTGVASKSVSGERTITPSTPIQIGAPASPEVKPVIMTNKTLGPATGSKGLATDGMLVTVCGKLTGLIEDPFCIYIDDGSGVPSGIASPDKGVKVVMADGSLMHEDPAGILGPILLDYYFNGTTTYAKVTGIVRLEKIDGVVYRRIDARSFDDIVLTATP